MEQNITKEIMTYAGLDVWQDQLEAHSTLKIDGLDSVQWFWWA